MAHTEEGNYETLLLERDRDWLTIWFNRPEQRNALSNEMFAELNAVIEAIARDDRIRGITLRGKGGVFCAGGDLKGFRKIFQGDAGNEEEAARFNREAGVLFDKINSLPQVVVMLVEGAAMAGGLGMVCAGDVVLVAKDAKFAVTETTLGLPPAQIAPFLVERLGLRTARRLMLTASRFTGADATGLGLADFVADDAAGLEELEAQVRRQVRRCAPRANAVTKDILLATRHLDREAMIDHAAKGFAECMVGDEAREGISAFLEKRKPRWAKAAPESDA